MMKLRHLTADCKPYSSENSTYCSCHCCARFGRHVLCRKRILLSFVSTLMFGRRDSLGRCLMLITTASVGLLLFTIMNMEYTASDEQRKVKGRQPLENNKTASQFNGFEPLRYELKYPKQDSAINEPSMCNSNSKVQFNCTNLRLIKLKHVLGRGVSKHVFLGTYCGQRVAVKMVTRHVLDVKRCQQHLHECALDFSQHNDANTLCYSMPNMKLMKEILLLQQLRHPGLLQLLGYCVRSEETLSTSLIDHGIVAVYEYGQPFYMSALQQLTLKERLTIALKLLDLMDYFQQSPLGSLLIGDFKREHFLLVNGSVKLTDLDDVTSVSVHCIGKKVCTNSPQCQQSGEVCVNYNAMENLKNLRRLFLVPLFTRPAVGLRNFKNSNNTTYTMFYDKYENMVKILIQNDNLLIRQIQSNLLSIFNRISSVKF